MSCKAHFFLLNEHFSIEHAEANHNGEESEMNPRYEWEDELMVNGEFERVDINEYSSYFIQGAFPDGKEFKFEVNPMRVFNLISTKGEVTQMAISESIIDSYDLIQIGADWELSVFIKDYEPLSNPIPGVYIAAQDFPKELIEES